MLIINAASTTGGISRTDAEVGREEIVSSGSRQYETMSCPGFEFNRFKLS